MLAHCNLVKILSSSQSVHHKNHAMHCCWKNKNILVPHENSNVFIYLTVFTDITCYKPVLQLIRIIQTRIIPGWGPVCFTTTSLCLRPANDYY